MGTRVLHISDLHFGRGWEQYLWDDLRGCAERLEPDLIVVTGDLVNSPYRYRLARATTALRDLATRVRKRSGRECRIIVVPGNHDTRVLGNVPLRWVTMAAIVSLLLAAAAVLAVATKAWGGPGWVAGVILAGGVALTVYRCLLQNFWNACKDLAPKKPQVMQELGLIVYPYDSATPALTGARGQVGIDQFVTDAEGQAEPGRDLFPIALVHHHPLPIPYQHQHEPLLVLDNAGAFLNEVSRKRIRLILHGHKHHQNYARCTIRMGTADEFEIGVLASGTTTAGRDPGPSGFNFHVLELSEQAGVVATPYVASPGGTFAPGSPIVIEPRALRLRRLFEASLQRAGCEYSAVFSVWHVNADGDVHTRTEHRDFRVVRDDLTFVECPQPVRVGTETGHIERFSAGPLSRRGAAGVQLIIDKTDPAAYSLSTQEGRLTFGRVIRPDESISYFVSHDTLNGCAVSREQFREMYPDQPPQEWQEILLQAIPARDLVLVVDLPRECRIEGEPELVIQDPREQARVADLNAAMLHDQEAGLIIARVPYPILGVNYKVQWLLAEATPVQVSDRFTGEADQLARGLLGLARPAQLESRQAALADQLVDLARRDLELSDTDPVEVCLMAYDRDERELRVVAASFPAADPRWEWKLHYGNGIAGRAFKANLARLFIKERAYRLGTPLYYIPVSGQPVLDRDDIPEAVILSLPLSHPNDRRAVWGVLSISSPLPGSRLVDLAEDDSRVKDLWKTANEACFMVGGEV